MPVTFPKSPISPRPFALLATLSLLLASAVPALAADAGPAWPDTDPARHARAFFDAFGRDEAAMRAFWTTHGSAAALAERPVELRLEVWRGLRERLGTLVPLRVTDSAAGQIVVRARTAHDELMDIHFPCDDTPQHGLIALLVAPAEESDDAPRPTPPAGAPAPPSEDAIIATLTAQADSMLKAGTFRGAWRFDRGDATLASRAYGLASIAAKRANRMETRFNLGSIDKIFTTVAIRQLVEQGRMSLDDPIVRYLPDYRVANAERVTIGMLLDHRGGVLDVLESPGYEKQAPNLRSLADWYALVREQPLRFEPGTRQEYSNGGFILLGMAIEKVSGEDYYGYVAKHVLAPAGMTATGHFSRLEKSPDRAECLTSRRMDADDPKGEGPWVFTGQGVPRGSSAGGGWSTCGDLVRFANALRAGKLLGPEQTRAMLGAQTQLAIAGGSPGTNALLAIAGPYTLVILANADPPAAEALGRPAVTALRRLTGATPPRTVGGPGSR